MDSNVVIQVENIGKTYKLYNKPIYRLMDILKLSSKPRYKLYHSLEDINFEICKGDIVGIIGRNGAGKSTLLKILAGVITSTSGALKVNGKISALLELGAGFNSDYTGIENIYLNGAIMGYNRSEMDKKLTEITTFADVGEFINQPLKAYSSGMFARLAFAVAISVNPDILIVDEILSVGDMRFQIKCMDKMMELMNNGTTVIFVSHDLNAIRRFCKTGIFIESGKISAIGEINEVADQYIEFLKQLDNDNANAVFPKFNDNFPKGTIAKIADVTLINSKNQSINTLQYDEPVQVKITYDVYDDTIDLSVLGVAIYSSNEEYICGLNTLLDSKKISWKYGRNVFYIDYFDGLMLVGGEYYFYVALFEKSATVCIDFNKTSTEFTVTSGYCSEGKFIIPHKWRQDYNE